MSFDRAWKCLRVEDVPIAGDVPGCQGISRARREAPHLSGLVRNPRMQTPAGGNSYSSVDVLDGTGHVPVISWGPREVAANDLVEVRGTFHGRLGLAQEALR